MRYDRLMTCTCGHSVTDHLLIVANVEAMIGRWAYGENTEKCAHCRCKNFVEKP